MSCRVKAARIYRGFDTFRQFAKMLALSNTRTCTSAASTRATTQAKSTTRVHTVFAKSSHSSLSCQLRSAQSTCRSLQASSYKRRVTSVASTVALGSEVPADDGNVEKIESPEQWNDALKRAGDKLVRTARWLLRSH
eukprot:5943263-Pyramimonas_sp.AAC.1